MSNGDTRIDVSSEGEYHLRLAIELALVYHTGPTVGMGRDPGCSHYMLHDNGIWFGWHDGDGLITLPAKMGVESLSAMTLGWLRESADYGSEPDIDGSTSRGWRLLSHFTLMPDVSASPYLSFGVRPAWMEYHK